MPFWIGNFPEQKTIALEQGIVENSGKHYKAIKMIDYTSFLLRVTKIFSLYYAIK